MIYNCCNYVNAYYNNHDLNSVDGVELAIASVWLGSKANSNFKRLDKIVLTARHLWPTYKSKSNIANANARPAGITGYRKCDREYYSCIEMDILQSLGFQLDLADDYPQKYITKFINKMTETCDAFRANLKKMKTTCDVAMSFANQIANITPMMINREPSVLAAGCLYISNNFKPILNKENWWKIIENCEDLKEKTMVDTADLIYDILKYSQNHWALVQQLQLQQQARNMQNPSSNILGQTGHTHQIGTDHQSSSSYKTINSPYSNYSSASNQTSGFFSNGSSPHSSMVSLPSMLSPMSSGFSQPINKMKTESQKVMKEEENWEKRSEGAVRGQGG